MITVQPPTPEKSKKASEEPESEENSFMSDASRNSSGFGGEVPRRTHDRIMDNTFQFQRMIRSAIAALPTATNSKPQFLKFLVCADSEYTSFRNVLHSSSMMMRVFVKGLLSKLDEPLFSIVSNSVPEDYSEFRRALIRGTSFVRPRQVIETEARSMMQLPGETALQYFYKVENLLTEDRIASEMEEIPHAAKSAMYDMFQKELLKWLPNGLASPLNHIAKYQVFESFQEFKEFLQKEKEREESVAYIAGRFHSSPATAKAFTVTYNPLTASWCDAPEFRRANDGALASALAFPITQSSQLVTPDDIAGERAQRRVPTVPARAGFAEKQPEDISEECLRLRKQIEHYQRKEEEQRDKFQHLRMENMLTRWMSNMENKITSSLMRSNKLPNLNDYAPRRPDYDRQKCVTFNARPSFEYEQRRNNEYRRTLPFNNRQTFNYSQSSRPNYAGRESNENWKSSTAQNNGSRYVNPLVSSDRKNYETKN